MISDLAGNKTETRATGRTNSLNRSYLSQELMIYYYSIEQTAVSSFAVDTKGCLDYYGPTSHPPQILSTPGIHSIHLAHSLEQNDILPCFSRKFKIREPRI